MPLEFEWDFRKAKNQATRREKKDYEENFGS
jgi:hypothetical protein